MRRTFATVGLALFVSAGALALTGGMPVKAERLKYDNRGRVTYGPGGPNAVYQQGPHTRIYVSKRSWLDAGTEVLPGDRKFLDYAVSTPPWGPGISFGRWNNNRPIDRQPLSPPSDLGGWWPTRFPLY